MLKVLITIISVTICATATFAQEAPANEVIQLRFLIAQAEARALIAERTEITRKARENARDATIVRLADELAKEKGLSEAAMNEISFMDTMFFRLEAMTENHCLRNNNRFEICAEYAEFLTDYPKIYTEWIPFTE